MGKGSSAAQNVALLKYCRTWGIYPSWNLLIAVPGEEREDYEQILALLPLIEHLDPPMGTSRIQFVRFSRYADDPAAYGLELGPSEVYRYCYSGNEDLIRNIGIYYTLTGGAFYAVKQRNRDLYEQASRAVNAWIDASGSDARPKLFMRDWIFGISVTDSRSCAPQADVFLTGLSAVLYRQAWTPTSLKTLIDRLPDVSGEQIEACLQELIDKKLMIFLSGRYSLAVPVQ